MGTTTTLAAVPIPDDPDEDAGSVPPLPPDDRLWRHPSEMGGSGIPSTAGAPVHQRPDRTTPPPAGSRQLILASIAMLLGVGLTLAVLALTGALGGHDRPSSIAGIDGPASEKYSAMFAMIAPSIVRVDADHGTDDRIATGIVVRTDGYIVTTFDAIDAASSITVTVHDGTAYNATIVGGDPTDDIAVLHIDRAGMTVAAFATDDHAVDPFVVAHTTDDHDPWLAALDIDEFDRELPTADGRSLYGMTHGVVDVVMPTRTAVLCDRDGHVIGLATARESIRPMRVSTAIPFTDRGVTSVWSTPIDFVADVAFDLIADGMPNRPALGITTVDADAVGPFVPRGVDGAIVVAVAVDGPADRAGVEIGDVITAVDGSPVTATADLVVAIRDVDDGVRVSLDITRGSATLTLSASPTGSP